MDRSPFSGQAHIRFTALSQANHYLGCFTNRGKLACAVLRRKLPLGIEHCENVGDSERYLIDALGQRNRCRSSEFIGQANLLHFGYSWLNCFRTTSPVDHFVISGLPTWFVCSKYSLTLAFPRYSKKLCQLSWRFCERVRTSCAHIAHSQI